MTMVERNRWIKASISGSDGNCVEVALGETVRVRDTKDRDGGTLRLPATAWSQFAAALARPEC